MASKAHIYEYFPEFDYSSCEEVLYSFGDNEGGYISDSVTSYDMDPLCLGVVFTKKGGMVYMNSIPSIKFSDNSIGMSQRKLPICDVMRLIDILKVLSKPYDSFGKAEISLCSEEYGNILVKRVERPRGILGYDYSVEFEADKLLKHKDGKVSETRGNGGLKFSQLNVKDVISLTNTLESLVCQGDVLIDKQFNIFTSDEQEVDLPY